MPGTASDIASWNVRLERYGYSMAEEDDGGKRAVELVPKFEVKVDISVPTPPRTAGFLPDVEDLEEDEEDCFVAGAHGDLRGVGWDQTVEILNRERSLLKRWFTQAASHTDVAVESEETYGDIWPMGYMWLPVGTVAATAALNAAGCPTIWSCDGTMPEDECPEIMFFARADRLPLLIESARASAVGLKAYGDRLAVYSGDAEGFLRFAQRMVALRPAWVALRPLTEDEAGDGDPLDSIRPV